MKVTVLGSAAAEGWPGIFCACDICVEARIRGGKDLRTRTSYLIDNDIMVDCGPDTLANMLKYGLDLSAVTTMVITHSHPDHFDINSFHLREKPFSHNPAMMDVYCNHMVKSAFNGDEERMSIRSHYMRPFDVAENDGIRITALRALHNRQEDCLLFLIERGGKTLFISHDTGIYTEDTWKALEGRHLDAILFDCTMGKYPDGSNHMGLPDIIKVCDRMKKMQIIDQKTSLIANHFSHNGGLLHDEMTKEAGALGIIAGYDGLTFII